MASKSDLKGEKSLLVVGELVVWVGGENDSSVISLVKKSRLITFRYLHKSE